MTYPVEGVGKGVFAEVGEDFVVDLEGCEIGCTTCKYLAML